VNCPSPDSANTLGVCTSVFGHRLALSPAKLASLVETGIPWIEISALQTQHLNLFDAERVDELVRTLEALPIKVWSLHAPFCGLAMDDPDTRADGLRSLQQSVRVAHRFGARRVVVHPGRDVPSVDVARELDWLVDGLARAAEDLPPGMMLALETMGPKSLAGPVEDLLTVVRQLDASRVGICFDTGHVHTGAPPAAVAPHLAGRIVSVHLHDNHGDRDAHALPGEGTIDWPATVAALRDAGYAGPWMSEAGDERLGPVDVVREFQRRMARYL
jgi:sugar phosphate isomerase/epimerase